MFGACPAGSAAVHCGRSVCRIRRVAPAKVSFVVDLEDIPFVSPHCRMFLKIGDREEAGERRTARLEVDRKLVEGSYASSLELSGEGLPEVVDPVFPGDPYLKRVPSFMSERRSPEDQVSASCISHSRKSRCPGVAWKLLP